MPIKVALHHQTEYCYDRRVALGPQVIRLRPAPHARTPIAAYSLKVEPAGHFINWQQDTWGNYLARLVFPDRTDFLRVTVDLIADMTVVNPFDFFLEDAATTFPFHYTDELAQELRPFLSPCDRTAALNQYIAEVDTTPRRTILFLTALNQKVQHDIRYLIRLEPGVQSPDETLARRSGSCRDSALLLVHLLRSFGLAARFVSGYLIQLTPDLKPLDGPPGPEVDFTDLHAWTDVCLPGAGWVGLDPTSGLLTGEGHIPLAATPVPQSAAPISGCVDEAEVTFQFDMHVTRIHEDPRVTRPCSDPAWERIDRLGQAVDESLRAHDVRLTMGGEPTFVSIDDMEGAEWNSAAVGLTKQRMSETLIRRLGARFATGAMLHYGQGKWYPGESLPRWAYSCLWRRDGQPIWNNPQLLAKVSPDPTCPPQPAEQSSVQAAGDFLQELAGQLNVAGTTILPAHEDVFHILDLEQKLPADVDPRTYDLDDSEDRRRLARALERGLSRPVGFVLPLAKAWWQARPGWISGPWPFRAQRLFLIPGDSPIGLRLPLESLPVRGADRAPLYAIDPFAERHPLPGYTEIRHTVLQQSVPELPGVRITAQQRPHPHAETGGTVAGGEHVSAAGPAPPGAGPPGAGPPGAAADGPDSASVSDASGVIRTALCAEMRNGCLHVFMPPTSCLEDYLELVAGIELTAEARQQPVVIEGYLPPPDPRMEILKVTPDPGVIEVNVQPAVSWEHLKEITCGVYEEARLTRLGTEKFQLDGRHTGTGGGNHVVLGGPTPADSPFLRRPDLLRSMIAFWNNHPALSYLFSSLFIGPTSQSPRVDEGRCDALYEMETAFQRVPDPGSGTIVPWLVDRLFRHLLVDLTGNTHRTEICIDKLFSPDHAGGRLGLVELRAFEMPPHPRMSLTQQLLVRALVAHFWMRPYRDRLIHWRTALHDRFMLPYFLLEDLKSVLEGLSESGFEFDPEWFAPHLEFRCPLIGTFSQAGVTIELRQALEPWYVLGEEPGAGGTTRYVDSSVERLQIRVTGMFSREYQVAVNGIRVPLQATDRQGEFVAGVRYRAWQPPACLHPTIPVDTPLLVELVHTANARSLGGCRYHVDHPGGLNPAAWPVNALEAESRRAGRFFRMGHTGGHCVPRDVAMSPEFPCTLDLRRCGPGTTR